MPRTIHMTTSVNDSSALIAKTLSIFLILIVVAVLYFVREVFIPLALAILFSFLLAPLVSRIERLGIPRIPAAITAVFLALAAVVGIGFLVGGQLLDLAHNLPGYQKNLSLRIAAMKTKDGGTLGKAAATLDALGKDLSGTVPGSKVEAADSANAEPQKVELVDAGPSFLKFAQGTLGPLLGPVGTFAIVIVFVLFMLIKREDLRDRIIHLIGRRQLSTTTEALDEAASKVTGYLLMQVVVNVTFGVAVGIGLYFIGVPQAFVWGLMAVLLRFIPYIGAWIALSFPLILSLAATNSWTAPVFTLGLFAVIELTTGNVLEPWLYGAHTGLSPVAIMAATIFWTWLWGWVGLLLAMPLTVCVAVLGKYVPALGFLDALLGDEPILGPEERYYQRLLAMDRFEASQIAKEYLKTHSTLELYSEVFVPALGAAGIEEKSGTMDEKRERFVFETTRDLVEEYGGGPFKADQAEGNGEKKANETEPSLPERVIGPPGEPAQKETIFCLPASDTADEIVAVMLAQLLEQEGFLADSVSYKTLANEVVEQIREAGSQTVCISDTPPHDTLHTRYLCKVLRAKFPKLNIVVGLWGAELSEDKLVQRQGRLTADKVVTTLDAAMRHLRPFASLDRQPMEDGSDS